MFPNLRSVLEEIIQPICVNKLTCSIINWGSEPKKITVSVSVFQEFERVLLASKIILVLGIKTVSTPQHFSVSGICNLSVLVLILPFLWEKFVF